MSILIKIRETKNFTENELCVAKYIINNYKNIKNMSATSISEKTFTSISTVTRMCKKLDLSGFNELKISLIEELANLSNKNIKIENTDIDKTNDTKMIIEKLNKLSIDSLKETKLLQDVEIIDKVVDLISQKKVIDFYGMGASHLVCLDAQYKFMRAGKLTNAFKATDQQYIQAKNSNENHIAVIISYSGMTKEIVDIAEILLNKGIDTVSITKYANNEVSKRCKYNLYVTSKESLKRSAAIYSRIAMLNLIDVIYFAYSNKNYDEVIQKIEDTKINKIK